MECSTAMRCGKTTMLKLSDSDRELLKRPIGELIDEAEFTRRTAKCRPIIVGDACCKTAIEHGIAPWIAVLDWRCMRTDVDARTRKLLLDFVAGRPESQVYRLANPPGHLNEEALELAKELAGSKEGGILIIDGEDDLVALAFVSACSEGDLFYGQPKEGIVHVKIDGKSRELANRVISNMNRG